MNNLMSNFTGFNGRINRQAWWIGAIILAVAQFIVSWILGLIIPGGTVALTTDPAAVGAIMQRTGWQTLILAIIFAYPWLALTIKRRHDRNNNGYDAMAFVVLQILYSLVLALTGSGTITIIVGLIFLVIAIWLLVQCGFLRGTAGPNSYGADPLGG